MENISILHPMQEDDDAINLSSTHNIRNKANFL